MNLSLIEESLKLLASEELPVLEWIMIPKLVDMKVIRSLDLKKAVLTNYNDNPNANEMFDCGNVINYDYLELVHGNQLWGVYYKHIHQSSMIVVKIFDAYTFEFIKRRNLPIKFKHKEMVTHSIELDAKFGVLWIIFQPSQSYELVFVSIDTKTFDLFVDESLENKQIIMHNVDLFENDLGQVSKFKLYSKPNTGHGFLEFYQRVIMNQTILDKYISLLKMCERKGVYLSDYVSGRYIFNKDLSVIGFHRCAPASEGSKTMCAIVCEDEVRFEYPQDDKQSIVCKIMRRDDGAILFAEQYDRLIAVFR